MKTINPKHQLDLYADIHAGTAIETKEWLQLLPNLQHQAENVTTIRKKPQKIAV